MYFILRVVLVVGALSYLALTRGGGDPAAEMRRLVTLPSPGAVVPAVAAAVPAETRERVMRDVLARGLMAELSRRAGAPEIMAASRDTLNDADRTPAWRGVERH
ncbi:hypothetical protein [Methylobacterium sp. J-076]|uniref:hypothetical protein n=1 Tax=Methylobacterium sp. J-076 TaxID=2836655 RepID=UPI001FB8928B|nr:hypothetical protein [Methylobacterium sp. J-076]MCJ2014568.1 hypothetical protein [Methylobacterium sp. J-076]